VGGQFTTLSNGFTSAKRIAAWDGSVWSTLPSGGSNGVSGTVHALSVFDSKLYVGGHFTTLGDSTTSAKYIAVWDGTAWSTLPSGASNGVSGTVWALSVFGSKLYVGGGFTTLGDGTTSAKGIAAWDGNTWSTLPSGSSNGVSGVMGTVHALSAFGSKLYVGGWFGTLGDGATYSSGIAAWDGSAWSTLPSGTSNGLGGGVYALSAFGSKLYVGGWFTTLGDGTTSAKFIGAWDGSTWSTLPSGGSNGVSDAVYALTVFDSKLYVGGQFTTLGDGTTSAKRIAVWDGSAWSTLPIGASNGVSNAVYALTVFGSKLYIGGDFTASGDGTTSANYIVAWSPASSSFVDALRSPSQSSAGFLGQITSISFYSGKIVVGGAFIFTGDGTTSAKGIAAWDGSAWSTLAVGSDNGLSGTVTALSVFGSKLYVGGQFTTLGDGTTSAKGIAAWDGSVWSTLPSGGSNGVSDGVHALSVFGSKLYVGGHFTTLGDGTTSANYIAVWDGSTWSTLPSGASNGVSGIVFALSAFGSKLYVGGDFTTLGDGTTSANRISSWDGSVWSTLPSGGSNGVSSSVLALSVFGSKLYVGGHFTTLGDGTTSAKRIAAWDGSAWSTLPSGASNGVMGTVWALSVFGSKLYVGGGFTTLGDGTTSAKGIAAWDGNTWSNLTVGSSNGVSGTVYALSANGSWALYIGGDFGSLGDNSGPAGNFAALVTASTASLPPSSTPTS
jgi:trimeric autotransporter adhesin